MTDNTPIIRLFLTRMKPEFFKLSETERTAFMAKDRANLDELGMKAISMIDCSGRDDQWEYIGVESWPSMEAVRKREKFENEVLEISKYVDYETHLGIAQSFEEYGK
ncbi:MAG: hypothetical protein ABII81_07560 [Pseudomonadota bacterium]